MSEDLIFNDKEMKDKKRQNRLKYLIESKKDLLKNSGLKFKMSDDLSSVFVFTKSGGKYIISLKGIYDYETKKEIVSIEQAKSILLLALAIKNLKSGKISVKEKETLIKLLLLAWDLRKKIKK